MKTNFQIFPLLLFLVLSLAVSGCSDSPNHSIVKADVNQELIELSQQCHEFEQKLEELKSKRQRERSKAFKNEDLLKQIEIDGSSMIDQYDATVKETEKKIINTPIAFKQSVGNDQYLIDSLMITSIERNKYGKYYCRFTFKLHALEKFNNKSMSFVGGNNVIDYVRLYTKERHNAYSINKGETVTGEFGGIITKFHFADDQTLSFVSLETGEKLKETFAKK